MGVMVAKKLISILFIFSFLSMVVAVNAATIDVSQPTYITQNADYDRNPSITYDGSNYWLFYAKGEGTSTKGVRGTYNPDSDTYVIYYKTATSIESLPSAAETKLELSDSNRPANFDQRVVSATYFHGKIYAFVSSGQSGADRGLYYYVYESNSWTGPFTLINNAIARGGHVNVVSDANRIYLVWESSSDGSSDFYSWDETTLSSKIDISMDNMPKITEMAGSLYVVSIEDNTGDIEVYSASAEAEPSFTSFSTAIHGAGLYDPVIFNDGTELYVVSAPYDSGNDKQYLIQTRYSSGSWQTSKKISLGGYGGAYWWEYWPIGYYDGSTLYTFFTTETNSHTFSDGEIAYIALDWNLDNDHYFYIQNAITAANSGDTINVAAGTYSENLDVYKGINLQSVADYTTTIIAGSATTAINVNANSVTIDGFTITNPGGKHGVYLQDQTDFLFQNNWITNIGTSDTTTTGTNFGLAIVSSSSAVDTIQIKKNQFSQIRGGDFKSVDAIAVGWSNGGEIITNLVIEENTINDITTSFKAWGTGGKGAYGILVNHGTGTTGKTVSPQIINNHISNLEGLWAHGIGLEGNTPNAQVMGNTIENLIDHKDPSDAVAIQIEDNVAADTLSIQFNNFLNVNVGVQNVVGTQADATKNWWGDASGPSGQGTGTGARVTADVTFDPWLGAKINGKVVVGPITSGDVDVDFGPISVTAYGDAGGTGQINVFNYAERPWTDSAVFSGGSNFFNLIYIPIPQDQNNDGIPEKITQLDITFHNPGGSVIYWWDKGTETWAPCSNQVLNPDGSITVTVTAATTPTLDDLEDPPFGGGTPLEVPAMSPIFLVSLFLGIVSFGYFFIGRK